VVASLTLTLADETELRALFDQHLSKGRAFVQGATGVGPLEACELTLQHAGRTHTLRAEAVFVKEDGPGCGVGLQLVGFDAGAMDELRAFVEGAAVAAPAPEEPDQEEEPEGPGIQSLQERIRGLSLTEQQRMASGGTMQERIVLERTFGPGVWEALLGNPRLTIPEVAKIARKGTLPRPLVESIAGHPSWLAAPEVQRALLGNPRSTADVVTRVLRSMTRGDLTLVPQQTAYPQGVRSQAKKLLGK
jgi:hypothetical protein